MNLRLKICLLSCLIFSALLNAAETNKKNDVNIRLENELYILEIGSINGQIVRVLDKRGKIDLCAPLTLADNFRLFNDNGQVIFGKKQKLSNVKENTKSLILEWKSPLKDKKESLHDISVELTIRFVNEAIEFKLKLKNNSEYKITKVCYPIVGGLLKFGPSEHRSDTVIYCPSSKNWVPPKSLTLPFGLHQPGYPEPLNMAFVYVNNSKLNRGMYFGSHDKTARYKYFQFKEYDSDVFFNLIHSPHTPPGQEFEGSAVVVQFHSGDLVDAGRKIYRPWFKAEFGLMEPSEDWIRQNSFFQMIMMMLPEGNVNYTYKDIKQLAKDGLDYGITSLQLAGWQRGGHDDGYPYYEPDPRLGTWEELEEGIRQCHEVGVKVYFFVNIHPVVIDTKWYKNELKDYVSTYENGHPWLVAGWGMGTLGSRLKYTRPLMAFANPSFQGLRGPLLEYFKKLAEIGADGIHIDKLFTPKFDWNPRTGTGPDISQWEGTIQCVEQIDRECRAIRPNFRMSFECRWDRVLTFGCSTWWAGNMDIAREVFPEVGETVGHYMPYDYIGINNAVRMGYIVMLSPHKFNRSVGCRTWKGLSNYIKEVKRIRDELADTIFLGEFLHTREVEFREQQLASGAAFSTFRNLKTGKRACILTNNNVKPCKQTLLNFKGNSKGKVRIYKPFQKTVDANLPVEIDVEPERITFLVEQ